MASPESARSPFDDADADVVVRSSDEVKFRLYKVILAKASPVFRTMFALPQPSTSASDSTAGPEVVPLTEDAKTLENLFRLCYPVEPPPITSLDGIHAILEAARKYEMESVTVHIRRIMAFILPKEPLRIYAIAYIMQMEDIARQAANLLLDMPQFHVPPSSPPEFVVLPCLALYSVHTYRQACVAAALRALEDRDWVFNGSHERAVRYSNGVADKSSSWAWITCGQSYSATMIKLGSTNCYLQNWYQKYLDSTKGALSARPSGRTVRSFLTSVPSSEALTQAASCATCMPKAYLDLARFNQLLAEKIDEAIAQVEIELPFASPASLLE